MYNPQLKTFLQVAKAGSFSKAAALLYITPPAVIKQINQLEKSLGVTLFERTHRGLELTEAGIVLHSEATQIVRHCDAAAYRVRQAAAQIRDTVRIGFSPLTPADLLDDILPQVRNLCPNLQIQMVPFINNNSNAAGILNNLGQDIDIVMGIFDSTMLKLWKCAGIELFQEPLCCALSIHHPLASKESLSLTDLYGQTLMLRSRGWSHHVDALRDDLKQHPQIRIMDFDSFEIRLFNHCVNENALLMAVAPWENVHPQIRILPVDWDCRIPYGLLHSPTPTPAVRHFISAVQQVTCQGSDDEISDSGW